MTDVFMNEYRMAAGGPKKSYFEKHFYRISRWITVQRSYNPNKRNRLWEYVEDEYGYKPYQDQFNPKNGLTLDYFRFHGRTYAIEQFLRLGSFFICESYSYEDNDGSEKYLCGVDAEDYFDPLYIEMDEFGEHVRLYRAA